MNLDRYEKIDGREALRRLADGGTILDGSNHLYLLNWTNFVVRRESGAYETVNDGLKQILEKDWYIPNPFDVRQAMRDRPNEWVGKFKEDSEWWAVGFDSTHFNVVAKQLNKHLPVDTTLGGMTFPSPEDLNACIPIEDVPEEATR